MISPGSSPHTWGIQYRRKQDRGQTRFIPTYVGHTIQRYWTAVLPSVHPHIRGAYSKGFNSPAIRCGSSPHTWGILFQRIAFTSHRRFIPTYVGHTRIQGKRSQPTTVHPHIRGAYPFPRLSAGFDLGSSPHTWGILIPPHTKIFGGRFIPTYVGHTHGSHLRTATVPVHPHIRGAYCVERPVSRARSGSSPHTWGIPGRSQSPTGTGRFIPTYVGHTYCGDFGWNRSPVHPHIRGAYKLASE